MSLSPGARLLATVISVPAVSLSTLLAPLTAPDRADSDVDITDRPIQLSDGQ